MKSFKNTLVISVLLFTIATLATAAPTPMPFPRDSSFNLGWKFSRVEQSTGTPITGWKWAPVFQSNAPTPPTAEWKNYDLGSDVLMGQQGQTCFSATLPAVPGDDHWVQITRVDSNAPSSAFVDAQLLKGIKQIDDTWQVLLNGSIIATETGNSGQFVVDLGNAYQSNTINTLSVVVDNRSGMSGGISDASLADSKPQTQMAASYDDSSWDSIDLPHTPKIETYSQYAPWQGLSWYRKAFLCPAAWAGKRVSLEFQGAMQVADVWVNGEHRTTHYGGFLPFTIDLSNDVVPGKPIIIAVEVDNRDNGLVPPGKPVRNADFEYYGGLYRDAILHVTDPLHITDAVSANKVAGGGLFVTYPEITKSAATVHLKTDVENDFKKGKSASVFCTLTDMTGRLAAISSSNPVRISPGSDSEIGQNLTVDSPKLWSPDAPNLYRLTVTVKDHSRVADQESILIGIRRFEFSVKTGFSINGQTLFLHGANRHQYYPWVGDAISDNEQYRDLERLKQAGWNCVRLCHYPQSTQVMDACDRLGLVGLVCSPGWQWYSGDPVFVNRVEQADRDMVRWHRNHASAMLWEVTLNEEYAPIDKVKVWMAAIHQELPGDQCFLSGDTKDYGDPKDFSLDAPYPGWNSPEMTPADADTSRKRFVREYGAQAQADRNGGEGSMLNQMFVAEGSYSEIHRQPLYMGITRWSYMDYVRGFATDIYQSGAVTIDRMPKFLYYFHQSQYPANYKNPLIQTGPMIHIANYWEPNSPTDVTILSNCDQVELLVNGRPFATQSPNSGDSDIAVAHPPFTFKNVPFEPGTLTAIGFIAGKKTVSTSVSTPGQPFALKLAAEEQGRPLTADGSDFVFIRANVVDSAGTLVPTNTVSVTFSSSSNGAIIGDNPRNTGAGTSSCLLKANSTPGTITVIATSPGLKPATLKIKSVPSDPSLRAWM